ncbi:hypothetical protein CPB84DRAFT_961455 [Gymnopilus junonius]|uniref:Uncharacterized protein n=1 Tax=Gymnopilus junonius TaxID=109634 RepID=A0A9P5TNI0_GYMJU|nr:hypothetical protein CPB84DRAFT_961455 [Gymnopilus junonius]
MLSSFPFSPAYPVCLACLFLEVNIQFYRILLIFCQFLFSDITLCAFFTLLFFLFPVLHSQVQYNSPLVSVIVIEIIIKCHFRLVEPY